MSFMEFHGKPYLRETREEQFSRYMQETGAAKAIQDALILLYRLPIKPKNLLEFFTEFFENGAKDIVALSLLRAELCFKHSETQEIHKRIQVLEEQINNLEPHDSCEEAKSTDRKSVDFYQSEANGIKKDEDDLEQDQKFRFSLTTDSNENTNMMNRFLEDLDDAPRGSTVSTVINSRIQSLEKTSDESMLQTESDDINDIRLSETSVYIYDNESSLSEYSETGVLQAHPCFEEGRKDTFKSFQEDVKKLDPWGIVCRVPLHATIFSVPRKDHSKLKEQKPILPDHYSTFGNMSLVMGSEKSSAESELEYQNYDSDDAETLAEIYQSYAYDDEDSQRPKEYVNKILSVLQPAASKNPSLTDLLGWSPVTSEQQIPSKLDKKQREFQNKGLTVCSIQEEISCNLQKIKEAQKRNVFWPLENSYNVDNSFNSNVDDSFLLPADDMSKIAQKFDQVGPTDSFLFEFFNHHLQTQNKEAYKEGMEELCDNMCGSRKPSKSMRKIKKHAETMTIPYGICPCGDDECDCDCECGAGHISSSSHTIFGSNVPGKMTNWTNKVSSEFSDCILSIGAEDYSMGEDEEHYLRCMQRKQEDNAKKRKSHKSEKLQKKFLEDFAVPLSPVKSNCQCGVEYDTFSRVPSFVLDECSKFYKEQEEEAHQQRVNRKNAERASRLSRALRNQAKGTMTLTEEQRIREMRKKTDVDSDLAEVFKTPIVTIKENEVVRQSLAAEENTKSINGKKSIKKNIDFKGAEDLTGGGDEIDQKKLIGKSNLSETIKKTMGF